jgi:uncharacterized protein YdeI (YjbR/CyaY-like superfamily)
MGKKDPRVDAYIAKSADFAKPILRHLRSLVHKACPDVEETLKWGMPSFLHEGILCGIAAFKEHCAFGFWKGSLILDEDGNRVDEAMGQFGRITKLSDLPGDKVLLGYIKKAARLNDEGVKVPGRGKPKPRKPVAVPPDLRAALAKTRKASAAFEGFSYTNKKEYVDWITEARTEETRKRRLATAVEWMSEGKIRNWKYVRR